MVVKILAFVSDHSGHCARADKSETENVIRSSEGRRIKTPAQCHSGLCSLRDDNNNDRRVMRAFNRECNFHFNEIWSSLSVLC